MSPACRIRSGDLVYFLMTMGDLSGDSLCMSPQGLVGTSGDLSGDDTSEGSGVINLGLGTPDNTNSINSAQLEMFHDVCVFVCACVCVCIPLPWSAYSSGSTRLILLPANEA